MVGKLLGVERAAEGGVGVASVTLPDGTLVSALAAVNAVGDVVDPETGAVVAGPGASGFSLRKGARRGAARGQPVSRRQHDPRGRRRPRRPSSPELSSAWRSKRTTASRARSVPRTRSSTATSYSPWLRAAPLPRLRCGCASARRPRGSPRKPSSRRCGGRDVRAQGHPPRRRGGPPVVDRRHRDQVARRAAPRHRLVPVGVRRRGARSCCSVPASGGGRPRF